MYLNNFIISIYYISFIVSGHYVDLFALKVGVLVLSDVLCHTLLAVPHPWELS